jgi:hypothetical protein
VQIVWIIEINAGESKNRDKIEIELANLMLLIEYKDIIRVEQPIKKFITKTIQLPERARKFRSN